MNACLPLPFALIACLVAAAALAGPERFEARGSISNNHGVACHYQQKVIPEALHFHGDAISTTIGEIVFDDPGCMRAEGPDLQANKALINRMLATLYSHPDADFDTETLYESSLYQEVGVCMQSRNFAAIGIAIEYVIEDGSIVRVFHGPTLEGCLV